MAFRTVNRDTKPNTHFKLRLLQHYFPAVAAKVQGTLGLTEDAAGMVHLNLYSLPKALQQELMDALKECGKRPDPDAKPDDSMQKYEAYQKQVEADIARQAARLKIEREADAKVAEYVAQGLFVNERNKALITEHIEKNSGIYCAASVWAAVEGERHNLQWGQPPAPAQPVVEQPAVELLPSGEPRLPLTTVPNRSHSIAQLRDLDARQRAAKAKHPGVFGTSL